MLIFLIGYMGCGKSSIGRKLASKLGFSFIDTDKRIESECGASVSEIFAREGELRFRELERAVLMSLEGEQDDAVVATGGGMPCFGDNMESMNRMGLTVYLKLSPEKLSSRLSGGGDKRPILRGMDDLQLGVFVRENLKKRESCYCKASVVVECDGASDEYICRHVAECVRWKGKV